MAIPNQAKFADGSYTTLSGEWTMKVLVSAMTIVVLMIGAQSAYPRHLTDAEQETGIGADKQHIPCTFGPSHDECRDQSLKEQITYLHSRQISIMENVNNWT